MVLNAIRRDRVTGLLRLRAVAVRTTFNQDPPVTQVPVIGFDWLSDHFE